MEPVQEKLPRQGGKAHAWCHEWRYVLAVAHDVLTWKQKVYCRILAGFITLTFLFYWYMDWSFVTTVAAIGLEFSFLDFVVTQKYDKSKWTQDNQRKYLLACEMIDAALENLSHATRCVRKVRAQQPKIYYLLVFGALAFIWYMGQVVNNTLLLYAFTLTFCLLPGFIHHGIVQRRFGKFFKELQILINTKVISEKGE